MKLFKNILAITLLFAAGLVDAKQFGEAAPAAPKPTVAPVIAPSPLPTGPAPALPGQGFQYLLDRIKMMPSGDVIDASGAFSDNFITMVRSSGFPAKLQEALFRAGIDLHLSLSGDDVKDDIALNGATEKAGAIINQPIKKAPVAATRTSREAEMKDRAIANYIKGAFAKLQTMNQVNDSFVQKLVKELGDSFDISDEMELLNLMTNGLVNKFTKDTSERQNTIERIGAIVWGQPYGEEQGVGQPVTQPTQPAPQPAPQLADEDPLSGTIARLSNGEYKNEIQKYYWIQDGGVKEGLGSHNLIWKIVRTLKHDYKNITAADVQVPLSTAIGTVIGTSNAGQFTALEDMVEDALKNPDSGNPFALENP